MKPNQLEVAEGFLRLVIMHSGMRVASEVVSRKLLRRGVVHDAVRYVRSRQ